MDCQNVEETRNPMQKSGRKKCTHFFQRMFHLHFRLKSIGYASYPITSHVKLIYDVFANWLLYSFA